MYDLYYYLHHYIIMLKVMTQQIHAEQEEKISRAQALMRCYDDSVAANRKLIEMAAGNMEEPDMAAFIQVGCSGRILWDPQSDLLSVPNLAPEEGQDSGFHLTDCTLSNGLVHAESPRWVLRPDACCHGVLN